ncbi:MAG: hypothetical protein Q8Q23_05005 [bacterium]|nr:hypothetical protein [bacterium]
MQVDKKNERDKIVEKFDKKLQAKDKRKRPKMRVSGGRVKHLQVLIKNKKHEV